MFRWMKSSSSKKIRFGKCNNRSSFSRKRKEQSTTSLWSVSDFEVSVNLDLEDSFSTTKESTIFTKSKQLSRRIVSIFQRKSKDVVSADERRKSQSTANLLNRSVEKIVDPEAEDGEETKDAKQRSRKMAKRFFMVDHKGRIARRKPLDDYAKKKLQISRDSGWEGASFSSSSSFSSLANERAAFSMSTPITKTDLKEKQPRIPSKGKNSRAIVRRKTILFSRINSRRFSREISNSEEELKPLDDDKSSSFSDSGICVSGNSSNDFVNEENKSNEDIVDKLSGLKYACSLTHLSANVKRCEECALSYDASTDQERNHASGFSEKVSTKSVREYSEELKPVKRGNSVICIPGYVKSPLKNAESSVAVTSGTDPKKSNEVKNLLDVSFNETLERHRLTVENTGRRIRSWISKSTDQLCDNNSLCSSDDVAEFSSLNGYDGGFINEALNTSDENCSVKNREVQEVSHNLEDYEVESSPLRFFDSFNSSYVITMYV